MAQKIRTNQVEAVAFRVYSSSTQSMAANSDIKISLNTPDFDIGDNFNTSSNRFIAPYDGVYHFDFAVRFASSLADGQVILAKLKVNGSDIPGENQSQGSVGSVNTNYRNGGITVELEKDDYVELYGHHNNGTRNVAGELSGHLVVRT